MCRPWYCTLLFLAWYFSLRVLKWTSFCHDASSLPMVLLGNTEYSEFLDFQLLPHQHLNEKGIRKLPICKGMDRRQLQLQLQCLSPCPSIFAPLLLPRYLGTSSYNHCSMTPLTRKNHGSMTIGSACVWQGSTFNGCRASTWAGRLVGDLVSRREGGKGS